MKSENHADIDTEEIKKNLIQLDDDITSFRTRAKKYKMHSYLFQLTILALSPVAWHFGYIYLAICLFVFGMPFSEEWYDFFKLLFKKNKIGGDFDGREGKGI